MTTRTRVEAMQSVCFAWAGDWDEDGDSSDHTFVAPMRFEIRRRGGVEHGV